MVMYAASSWQKSKLENFFGPDEPAQGSLEGRDICEGARPFALIPGQEDPSNFQHSAYHRLQRGTDENICFARGFARSFWKQHCRCQETVQPCNSLNDAMANCLLSASFAGDLPLLEVHLRAPRSNEGEQGHGGCSSSTARRCHGKSPERANLNFFLAGLHCWCATSRPAIV